MNKIIISGNLVKDCDMRFTAEKGTALVKFTVAVARGYKKEEGVDFINATLWGKRAEALAGYLIKGTKVIVEGKLRINIYDKPDGTKVYNPEINVDDIDLIGSEKYSGQPVNNYSNDSFGMEVDNGDIPF